MVNRAYLSELRVVELAWSLITMMNSVEPRFHLFVERH